MAHHPGSPVFGSPLTAITSFPTTPKRSISRPPVLCCVERRKAWRMLQSKAGIENREYKAQRAVLAEFDAGTIPKDDRFGNGEALLRARMAKPPTHVVPAAPAAPLPTGA